MKKILDLSVGQDAHLVGAWQDSQWSIVSARIVEM